MLSELFKLFRQNEARQNSERPENPYVTGNVVGGSYAFIGRTDILQKVANDLLHFQQNAIVLYGQPRIGKTSILKELEDKLPQKGNYQPIYLNLMGKEQQSFGEILNYLASTICLNLKIIARPQWENIEAQFHLWLIELVEGNQLLEKSLVLLFDEFDVLDSPRAEKIRDTFFTYLREELVPVNPRKLNFVFAIGRNMADFQSASALFRTMLSYRVSLLTEEETNKLIRLSEEYNQSLYWSKSAVKKIWELAHGHPLLTQLLCSHLWQWLWDQEPANIPTVTSEMIESKVQQITNGVFTRHQGAFDWLWRGLSPACKIDTAAFAELGSQAISQKALVEYLSKNGIGMVVTELEMAPKYLKEWDIIEGDGSEQNGYRFRVELFRRWVVLHHPLTEILQTELGKIRIEAQRYYQQAQLAYQNKQLDTTIDNLKSAIRIHPQFIEAHQLLGRVLVEKGELVEAQTVLEKFYNYCPSLARSELIELLWIRINSVTNKKDQLTFCEQILTKYDSAHSSAKRKKMEILQWRAKKLEDDEKYEEASKAFQEAELREEAFRVWRKGIWAKYERYIKGVGGGFVPVLISSYFLNDPISIPWWAWGSVLGIVVGLLVAAIPFKKTKHKKF